MCQKRVMHIWLELYMWQKRYRQFKDTNWNRTCRKRGSNQKVPPYMSQNVSPFWFDCCATEKSLRVLDFGALKWLNFKLRYLIMDHSGVLWWQTLSSTFLSTLFWNFVPITYLVLSFHTTVYFICLEIPKIICER